MSQDIDITNTLLQALIEDKPFDIHIPDPPIIFFLKNKHILQKLNSVTFNVTY